MASPVVMLCGSRSLSSGQSLAGQVVGSLLGSGSVLAVGCATGADAVVVSSVLAAGAANRLRLFAVGGEGGAGFAGRLSAISGVVAAADKGASVIWWAGGTSGVPVRVRLARRSLACVQAAAAGGSGSGLVAFVSGFPSRSFGSGAWPSCGSGSWSSAAAAARMGLPVVVFPVGQLAGVVVSSFPVLPGGGLWVPVGRGIFSGGFRWVPELSLLADPSAAFFSR